MHNICYDVLQHTAADIMCSVLKKQLALASNIL